MGTSALIKISFAFSSEKLHCEVVRPPYGKLERAKEASISEVAFVRESLTDAESERSERCCCQMHDDGVRQRKQL